MLQAHSHDGCRGDIGNLALSKSRCRRFDVIRLGEPAELVVVSKSATFSQFKALQEAYLPESAAWLARYPFLARDVFLEISLEIERERQAAGQQGQ